MPNQLDSKPFYTLCKTGSLAIAILLTLSLLAVIQLLGKESAHASEMPIRAENSSYGGEANDEKTVALYANWEEDYGCDSPDTIRRRLFKYLNADALRYGDTRVKGSVFDEDGAFYDSYVEECDGDYVYDHPSYLAGTSIAVKIGNAIYRSAMSKSGYFCISTPGLAKCKVGTKVSITFTHGNLAKTITRTVRSNSPKIAIKNVYGSSKKAKVTVKRIHKGDVVKLKIGKKTYRKKVTKNKSKLSWTTRIKMAKPGTKIKVTVLNRFKQKLSSKSDVVYLARKVRLGMTRKQVKLVPGHNCADKVRHKGPVTCYVYDWDGCGEYLYFRNGELFEIRSYVIEYE